MKGLRQQRGMTAIGWLIVLALIAFFTLITLRLAPLYMEFYKVVSVLESLQKEPGVTRKTKAEIRTLISRRFDVNDVSGVSAKQASIVPKGDVLTVGINYERRVSVFGNIDVVAKFNKEVTVVAN
jgi:hypothetical protein